jgi:hypothetical protein
MDNVLIVSRTSRPPQRCSPNSALNDVRADIAMMRTPARVLTAGDAWNLVSSNPAVPVKDSLFDERR